MRIDQQYILFPEGTEPLTFQVTWNSSGYVELWIAENTLNGTPIKRINGPNGNSGNLVVNASVGTYWQNPRTSLTVDTFSSTFNFRAE
jgi:hypothetical protein